MSYTLTDLLQDMYTELGQGNIARATGGSTTSVVDSKLSSSSQGFVGWTIFLRSTTDGLAPQGEYRRVTAYDAGVFTTDAFTAAVEADDEYLYVSAYYPLYNMIKAANDGLRNLGPIALVDATTLTTVEGQTEYTAALEWKRERPLQIAVQTHDASGDYRWMDAHDWDYIPAAPGSTGLIVFKRELDAGKIIRVLYNGIHPELKTGTDLISETIPRNLAVYAGVQAALSWQNGRQQGNDKYLLQRENKALSDLERARMETPIWKPNRKTRLMIIR